MNAFKSLHWLNRWFEGTYSAAMPGIANELYHAAPGVYRKLVQDPDSTMAPELEKQIARRLPYETGDMIIPSKTLLPHMAELFGARLNALSANDPDIRRMAKSCNNCNQVRHCWLSLRNGLDTATGACFCPNAEKLSEMAMADATQ